MDRDTYVRIDAGIDLLNDQFGSIHAWINRIDLDALDMFSLGQCIIGQLFGYYKSELWCAQGETSYYSGHRFGFDDESEQYAALTEAWIIVISNLRSVI